MAETEPVANANGDGALEASDAVLVARAAKGDSAAMGELFVRYRAVVHGVLLANTCRDDVDDLVQDVFLTATRRIGTLRDGEALCAWLMTIARRKASSARRAKRRWLSLRDDHRAESSEAATLQTSEVMAAIRGLPEAYRETLVWRLVEGLSGPQIAQRTGMTDGSVRVNLHRGLALLREALEGEQL